MQSWCTAGALFMLPLAIIYLGPLYAAALAWFVLGEPLHAYHAVGALIILPGIFLA